MRVSSLFFMGMRASLRKTLTVVGLTIAVLLGAAIILSIWETRYEQDRTYRPSLETFKLIGFGFAYCVYRLVTALRSPPKPESSRRREILGICKRLL